MGMDKYDRPSRFKEIFVRILQKFPQVPHTRNKRIYGNSIKERRKNLASYVNANFIFIKLFLLLNKSLNSEYSFNKILGIFLIYIFY